MAEEERDTIYIPLYFDYYEDLADLDDNELGRVIRAILAERAVGQAPELSRIEKVAYNMITRGAKRAEEKYKARMQQISEARREAANKRWEKEKARMQSNANDANVDFAMQSNANDAKEKEKEKEKKKEKGKTSSNDVCVESSDEASAPVPDTDEIICALILNDRTLYHLTESMAEQYEKLYPAVDVRQEFRNMAGWCDVNTMKRKTRGGVKRFVNNWLAREQNKYKGSRTPVPDYRPPQNNSNEMFDFLNAVIEGRDNDPSGNSSHTENP